MMSIGRHITHIARRGLMPLALLIVALLAGGMLVSPAHAVTITILNGDAPGEGFNDLTPFTPVGGNNATTLGQARLNAFQHAANIWAAQISSPVPIEVYAQMNPLGGTGTGAVLGFAGATRIHANFSGAPLLNTWYPTPLANKLHGADLTIGTPGNPTTPSEDIDAQFNSDVDGNTVLHTIHWYYGFDGNPPTHPDPFFGTVQDEDFVSVVLHELGHGLGFSAEVVTDPSGVRGVPGSKLGGIDGTFMRNVEHHGAVPSMFPAMTDAQRIAAYTSVNALHFTGASTVAARGGHAELYAPATVAPGSTLSHFDETTLPLELMSPFASGPQHNVGLAAKVLQDIGWGAVGGTPPAISASVNGTAFTAGQTMTLTISTTAGAPPVQADAYIALQLPDGTLLLMQPNLSFSPAINPLLSNWTVQTLSGPLFSFMFTGAEPKGTYTWFVGLAQTGTLNFIGAIGAASFTLN